MSKQITARAVGWVIQKKTFYNFGGYPWYAIKYTFSDVSEADCIAKWKHRDKDLEIADGYARIKCVYVEEEK